MAITYPIKLSGTNVDNSINLTFPGNVPPIKLTAYYKSGLYVSGTYSSLATKSIPTSGIIKFSQFNTAYMPKLLNPISPLAISYDGTVNLVSSITFYTDGTLNGANCTVATGWFDPMTTNIGSSYWIKFLLLSGSPWNTGLIAGTVYALSSNRTISYSSSIGVIKNASVGVYIYSDSGGTNLVSSGIMSVHHFWSSGG